MANNQPAQDAPKPTGAEAARLGLRGRTAQSMNAVAEELNRQEKIRINIQRPQHIKKGVHYNKVVTINGYSYKIPTGQFCLVPEEVYLILVRSGDISPQRPEDECEVPAFMTMSGPEYDLMQQGGAGSIANPVVVQ